MVVVINLDKMSNLLRLTANKIGNVMLNRKAHRYTKKSLITIGKLETMLENGYYGSGQLILNKALGYRGVILFPWTTKLYDKSALERIAKFEEVSRPMDTIEYSSELLQKTSHHHKREVTVEFGKSHLLTKFAVFYLVLIDSRDWPYINLKMELVHRVEILAKDKDSVHVIPGLDFVSHDDIIPYKSVELLVKFHHYTFDHFFYSKSYQGSRFEVKKDLLTLKKNCLPWLELSQVYKKTTENITVTVIPSYIGSQKRATPNGQETIYWWSYTMRIENLSDVIVHTPDRLFKILTCYGDLSVIKGRATDIQVPFLSKRAPVFQFVNYISLKAPVAQMWGRFTMIRDNGYMFQCDVPAFTLYSSEKNAPKFK